VAQGGTGRATSTTAYGLLAAGTTATGAHQTLAAGATTEILVGGGASALPVWTTATGTGSPVRATSPTLVTPLLGTPTSGDLRNTVGYHEWHGVYLSDVTTDLTTGNGKASMPWPFTGTLIGIQIGVSTAPTGSTLIVDMNKNGTTMLSTRVTIDAGETSSLTADVPAVISVASITAGDVLSWDIDQVGSSTPGKQLIVFFLVRRS
jgi:hypothetical protein